MKNKKTVYFLVPVVILIWSVIFYRIYTSTGGDTALPNQTANISEGSYKMPEKKAFALLLNYADPFLSSSPARQSFSSPEREREKVVAPAPVLPASPEISYNWEGVRYLGLIENAKKKTSIALVEVQGSNYMLNKGESKGEILLLQFTKDSIQLKIGEEIAFIRKAK